MTEALTVSAMILVYGAILWRLHVWETQRINRRIIRRRLFKVCQ